MPTTDSPLFNPYKPSYNIFVLECLGRARSAEVIDPEEFHYYDIPAIITYAEEQGMFPSGVGREEATIIFAAWMGRYQGQVIDNEKEGEFSD